MCILLIRLSVFSPISSEELRQRINDCIYGPPPKEETEPFSQDDLAKLSQYEREHLSQHELARLSQVLTQGEHGRGKRGHVSQEDLKVPSQDNFIIPSQDNHGLPSQDELGPSSQSDLGLSSQSDLRLSSQSALEDSSQGERG